MMATILLLCSSQADPDKNWYYCYTVRVGEGKFTKYTGLEEIVEIQVH